MSANTTKRFVRLGHRSARNFWQVCNSLVATPGAQDEFKDLVQKLLDKITVNRQTLSATNDNLPWI